MKSRDKLLRSTIQLPQHAMNAAAHVITSQFVIMWNQCWSCCIGFQLSREFFTRSASLSTSFALDRHHNIWSTASFKFLQMAADTGSGQLAQQITFCQEQEPNLESTVSASVVQPPGRICHLICTVSLTLPSLSKWLTSAHFHRWCTALTDDTNSNAL